MSDQHHLVTARQTPPGVGREGRYALLCCALPQGCGSSIREILCSAMVPRTWVSHAWGSTPWSLAISIKVVATAAVAPPPWEPLASGGWCRALTSAWQKPAFDLRTVQFYSVPGRAAYRRLLLITHQLEETERHDIGALVDPAGGGLESLLGFVIVSRAIVKDSLSDE